MTHSYVWHDSFIFVTWNYLNFTTWLIHIWWVPRSSCVFICVTWLMYTWHDFFARAMIDSHAKWQIRMWHDSFIRDMTPSYVTWLIHMWHDSLICDMTRLYGLWLNHTMSCHAFIHMNECNSCHVFIHTMNESYPIYICHSYECVIPYLYMSFLWSCMLWLIHTMSCHVFIHEWVMSHMNASYHVYICALLSCDNPLHFVYFFSILHVHFHC